jgi:beta-lactamase regulating signal transducer with metallopeptidase domain
MISWIQVAGWTLVHFVWQGAAIAAVAASGLRLLRTATPNARYTVASVALGAMLVSPVITAHLLSANVPTIVAPGTAPSILPSAVASSTAPRRDLAASVGGRGRAPAGRIELDPVLTILVAVWLTGVALLLLRLAGGWWKVRGLHRTALAMTASHWQTVASRLAALLRVRRVVHVVESVFVDTPTVVGWWRPVVFLPVAALANLTLDQVEAILAHELAHVRRHDYLVNLLQHIAETLLFYHPGVWWLSARMRNEREQCCDEIVLEVCGDPVGYASALTHLETWRHERATLAVAATHGSLIERIRLVLSVRPRRQRPLAHAVVTATTVGLLIAMVGGGYHWPLVALGATGRNAQSSTVSPTPASGVVLTVNGEPITDGDLEHFRPLHGEEANTPLPRVLVELVNERLVVQRGKQLGYAVTDGDRQDALAYVRRQNKVQTDAQLQTQLATQHLTMADLRQHLERAIMCFRVRQAEAFDRVEVTNDDARQYFETHLDEFPLQTFDLARTALVTRLKTAKLGQDLAPASYLQSLRMTAMMVWARADLERAYEEGLTQRAPQ